MGNVKTILSTVFGFKNFRPHQEAVVNAVLEGRDTFTLMPTGGGKSLCYQLPAKLLPGVCLVISPLISLMKDQVDAANSVGLKAAAYNSACTGNEKNATRRALESSKLDLLYLSPERLRLPDFMAYLKEQNISFIAIDEAHCISEWGHDFRPDYLALSSLNRDFPGIPLSAFTATATPKVEKDIIRRLCLRTPLLTKASFNRPNLYYQVIPKDNLQKQLTQFIKQHQNESGIIYRITRKDVEATAAFLAQHGVKAMPYHAGMSENQRAGVQEAFRRDECPVIVATIAFGMGIDKSNVRFVIHADLPKSLEGYYQETGRAGRDGEPAHCVLFYGRGDMAKLFGFAESITDAEAREISKKQLFAMLDFTQKEGCRRRALLAYFGEWQEEDNCGACDICKGEAEREDASVAAQKLLSAIVRTKAGYGARHVISIVMGKTTPRISALGHDKLPTFGVGGEQDERYWQRVMDSLIAQGLAHISDPTLPVPAVTEEGWKVLRGERSCSIIRLAKEGRKVKDVPKVPASKLFERLREERQFLAKAANVPPYIIFSDKTLREMCAQMPNSLEKMLNIHGIGEHKLKLYGQSFLEIILNWKE